MQRYYAQTKNTDDPYAALFFSDISQGLNFSPYSMHILLASLQ